MTASARSVVVLALSLPIPASAQRVERSLDPTAVSSLIAALQPGATVRVVTTTRQRMEGALVHVSDTSLTLRLAGRAPGSRTARLADVDTLWERRSAAATGALAGLVLGGLGGALVACQPSCDESGVVPGALITGLLGLGVGAVLGSASRSWHRRFPP